MRIKAANMFRDCTGTTDLHSILSDNAIAGVVLCTRPELHAQFAALLLKNNKQVFVEKPLGHSLADLREVISVQQQLVCQPGLQRRFSKVGQLVKKLSRQTISYNYRFLFGAYPEGDALYELFVHPIDWVQQLFGDAVVEQVSATGSGGKKTFFLTLRHGLVLGMLELSTNHSWQQPVDELQVTTPSGIVTARYPDHVSVIHKSPAPFGIPVEKMTDRPLKQSIYLDQKGLVPGAGLNSLQLQGFYPELLHFAAAVEKNNPDNLTKAESLLPAYTVLEQLRSLNGR